MKAKRQEENDRVSNQSKKGEKDMNSGIMGEGTRRKLSIQLDLK